MKFKLLVTTALCSIGFLATTPIFADSNSMTFSMGSQLMVINNPLGPNLKINLQYNTPETPPGHTNGFGSSPYVIGGEPSSFTSGTGTTVYYTDIMTVTNNTQATGNIYIRNAADNSILCTVNYDSRAFTKAASLDTWVYERGDIWVTSVGASCSLSNKGTWGTCNKAFGKGHEGSCKPSDSWDGSTIYINMSSYGQTN